MDDPAFPCARIQPEKGKIAPVTVPLIKTIADLCQRIMEPGKGVNIVIIRTAFQCPVLC